METIKGRTYGKSELADMYSISVRTLTRWLQPYQSQLTQIGYKHTCRTLNPKIVTFIFSVLGEPETDRN
ncbi:DUF4248 domain-containing protein [Cytophagaceae bacterium DM2B3-1]|uniref:DUF4248 domain-containing protein n=2 Tax=Xanthocytophaga TaxID=3078918 RepID=A0ABT7CLH5_9BACT|nr:MULTISPECIES: DUF4248 domain-containing protein [Xanthocytophaga]MDJ1494548.1 DUF4248 domain-containing protein [Xanthocytophaga flavus]MDJ1505011.1 DUF4248 domain-containing protein [Xanthocytophaga agilis]